MTRRRGGCATKVKGSRGLGGLGKDHKHSDPGERKEPEDCGRGGRAPTWAVLERDYVAFIPHTAEIRGSEAETGHHLREGMIRDKGAKQTRQNANSW